MATVKTWPGTRVRQAERAAVLAAEAAGDPDRHMRCAAYGLTVEILRRLGGTGPTTPTVQAPGHGALSKRAAGIGVAGTRVVIVVGPGGNGGDGLYAGAYLARRGAAVTAIAVTDRVQPRALDALKRAGGRQVSLGSQQAQKAATAAEVVIDAGFGTGARGGLPESARELWNNVAWKVAVDAPSGLDTDTGAVQSRGFTPQADLTVTFGAMKTGLILGQGRTLVGDVKLVSIPGLLDPMIMGRPDVEVLSPEAAYDRILSPKVDDHKYSRGVLGLLAGSPDYPGAAVLSSRAALATGVGMVTAYSRGLGHQVMVHQVPEAVVVSRECGSMMAHPQSAKVSAWLLGPGLGTEAADLALAEELLSAGPSDVRPRIVDASALDAIVMGQGSEGRPWVLTPHAGELKALVRRLDLGLPDPLEHPLDAVRGAAAALGCVVLLKGPTTLVATADGYVCSACCAGPELAVAGSGDTLAGILGALLATHAQRAQREGRVLEQAELAELAAAAAVIHGEAGAMQSRRGIKGVDMLARSVGDVITRR